jgi:hypothetical protein
VASLVAARKKSVFAISIMTDDWLCSRAVLFQFNAPTYNINASGTAGLWRVSWDFAILNAKAACPFHDGGFGVIYKYNLG